MCCIFAIEDASGERVQLTFSGNGDAVMDAAEFYSVPTLDAWLLCAEHGMEGEDFIEEFGDHGTDPIPLSVILEWLGY